MENTPKYLRNVRQSCSSETIPVFQDTGDAFLLHWWHVFMSMLGWPCFKQGAFADRILLTAPQLKLLR